MAARQLHAVPFKTYGVDARAHVHHVGRSNPRAGNVTEAGAAVRDGRPRRPHGIDIRHRGTQAKVALLPGGGLRMVAASSALGQIGIEISRGVAERDTALTIGVAAVGFTTVDVFDLLSTR